MADGVVQVFYNLTDFLFYQLLREVLKSPTIIMDVYFSLKFSKFSLTYFEALLWGVKMFRIIMIPGWTHRCISMKWLFNPGNILHSGIYLSGTNIAISAFSLITEAKHIFLYDFIFRLVASLYFKRVTYRNHIVGSCFISNLTIFSNWDV